MPWLAPAVATSSQRLPAGFTTKAAVILRPSIAVIVTVRGPGVASSHVLTLSCRQSHLVGVQPEVPSGWRTYEMPSVNGVSMFGKGSIVLPGPLTVTFVESETFAPLMRSQSELDVHPINGAASMVVPGWLTKETLLTPNGGGGGSSAPGAPGANTWPIV